jgi:peptidoglycan/xylan/chitin deacetylase (PgdA/CDA1 family)
VVPWARLAAAFAAVPVVLAALVLSDTALAQASGAVTPGTEVFRIQTKEKVVALTFDDA